MGSELARLRVLAGDEVFGLRRRAGELPGGVVPIAADLSEPASLADLPRDVDAVVYAVSAGAREEAAYRAAYVDGVRHLLAATGGVGRFVFVSSTSVYGQHEGEWVDEASETAPRTFSGRIVLEGERLALAQPGGCAVRFGGIYGPGRTRLRDSVAAGRARWRPGHFTNRIHRDDCAGVLEHVLGLAAPASVYVGVDCEPAEERTVYAWLARRAGVPEPPQATDRGEVARSEPKASEVERTDDGRATPGRPAGSKRCSNRRLLESGYRFRYPTFREGYAALG